MTEREALKEFEEVLMPEVIANCNKTKCGVFAHIRTALERAIPRQPIIDNGNEWFKYRCVICGNEVHDYQEFCWNCGNSLDWSEVE